MRNKGCIVVLLLAVLLVGAAVALIDWDSALNVALSPQGPVPHYVLPE